jgi:hypothetical protein
MEKEEINDLLNDMFNDETTKPETNWFAFEKVGDSVAGELIETFEREGKFGKQQVYLIKKPDGNEVNVPLKHTTHKFAIQSLKSAVAGDIVAFKFAKEIDTDYGNPAKSIEVRIRRMNK